MTVDLDALDKLLAAATPGPWTTDPVQPDCVLAAGGELMVGTCHWSIADASLIAAAVTALPELLRLARVGQAAVETEVAWAMNRDAAQVQALEDKRGDAIAAYLAATRAEAGR